MRSGTQGEAPSWVTHKVSMKTEGESGDLGILPNWCQR